MRFVFFARMLLMKAATVVVAWLLSSSFGFAAPAPSQARAGRACDAHVASVRKLVRQVKSFGGPVAPVSQRALAGLSDLTTLLKRGGRVQLDDDDEAIQNDTPAARIDDDESRVPALHPLGILDKSGERAPCAGAYSPRAPRGPPAPL
jgi:hypothetical protein